MIAGIAYGLLAQTAFVAGYVFINRAGTVSGGVSKTFLVLGLAGAVAAAGTGILTATGHMHPGAVSRRHWAFLLAGALCTMLIGQVLYIRGIERAGLAAISYTALAYPLIALGAESLLGTYSPSWRDAAGFALLAAGFVVITWKRAV